MRRVSSISSSDSESESSEEETTQKVCFIFESKFCVLKCSLCYVGLALVTILDDSPDVDDTNLLELF